MLKELFDVYKASNEKVRDSFSKSTTIPKFGDIVDMVTNGVFVTALCINKHEFILMSNFYEFATNTDLIVEIENHPVADTWMIELDKRLFVDLSDATYKVTSHLSTEDKKLVKEILDGADIPLERCGPMIPFSRDDYSWKFKLEETKKVLLINYNLFVERE